VQIVRTAWDKAKSLGIGPSLADRTRAVKADLHKWDQETLRGPKKRIKKLKIELEKLRGGHMNVDSQARQKEISVLIENLLEQEEIYWIQRGRANWLLHGDRNTTFFHNAATARKKRNQIKKLLGDNGIWVQDAELKSYIKGYFSNLFTSEVSQPNPEVISLVTRKVTNEMNNALMAPYT
jgi:hypothetical protein